MNIFLGNSKTCIKNAIISLPSKTLLNFTDLVPNAKLAGGTIFNEVGYARDTISASGIGKEPNYTYIGLIPIQGTVVQEIYVYGLTFSGNIKNRITLYDSTGIGLNAENGLIAGHSGALIESVDQLDDYYYKITTKQYSTKVKYFTLTGVTGHERIKPIVTMNEPIWML